MPLIAGLHTLLITDDGVTVFPRLPNPKDISELKVSSVSQPTARLTTGVPGLDDMMGGGIPLGSTILIAGPSGSGKTILSMQFLAAGITEQEPALLAVFEKHPSDYLEATPLGATLVPHLQDGLFHILFLASAGLDLG
jgi:circadian clock protein KaiC